MSHTTWRGGRPDWVLLLLLSTVALVVGYREMAEKFRCHNCIVDMLYPCVRQFGYTADPAALAKVPAYQEFWQQQQAHLSCAIVEGLAVVPVAHAWNIQKYLHAGQSAVLLITGPRFEGFWAFLGLLYAGTAAAAYGLFRLGMGRVVATAMTIIVIVSPFHRHHLQVEADYVKAPFVLALLFVVGLIVKRRRSTRETGMLAVAAGVVGGIGIGFKPDVLVCSLIAFAALILFVPRPLEPGAWRRWLAAPAFLITATIIAAPILSTHFFSNLGSLFPVQLLGGTARGHDDTHAAPSLYDYGVAFDDSWVTFQINSYAQRVLGANRFTNFQEQELTDHATAMVLDLERVFPADRVLRVFGAVFRILDLVPYGLWASIAVLIALYLTHPRHALFVSFVLLGFVGYVSLIFQARHYFHLMVVPLWMIGVVVHHGAMWARPWMADGTFPRWPSPGPAGRRLGVAALVAIACVATLVVLRSYQQSQVLDLIGSYERHVTFAPFAAVQHTLPDGRPGVAVEQAPLPEAGPGVFRSSYVVADVECLSQNDAEVTRVYATPEYFRHEYRVPCSMGQRHWRMWVPVYEYGSRWRFQGLEWRPADQIRVQQIRRVADLRATPLLLTLVLPDNWREQRYFHVLSWTALRTLQPWRL